MGNIVTLRNGQSALEPMVGVVFLSIKNLFENDPIGFFELVEICRDPSHKLFGNTAQKLSELALISDGQPNEIVRTVVLAATEGEGPDLRLVSPYAKQLQPVLATVRTSSLQDLELYKLAHKIADVVFDYCVDYYANDMVSAIPMDERILPWKEDRRKESVNPYYNQTNGFFIEMYYGSPSKLWTPWGKWSFGGSGCGSWEFEIEPSKSLVRKVLERTGAELYTEMKETTMGCYGPVYALRCVDGIPLPTAEELDRSAYEDYKDVINAWEELAGQL